MNKKNIIASTWSGHDASFCILENGLPKLHCELERFTRIKEDKGDAIDFLLKEYPEFNNINHFVGIYPSQKTLEHADSWEKIKSIVKNNNGEIFWCGHHQAHAANAYYSSNFDNAIILTLDGGGIEQENFPTACTIWEGKA